MLTAEEKNRYNRHIIMPEIGLQGQRKLKDAKVLVVGAGGLGSPILQYLTAAGVGTIGVVDHDDVDETNLQRQILYGVNDLGRPKAERAVEVLSQNNPLVKFQAHVTRIASDNILDIIQHYDIVVDGTDNFATRYMINDACLFLDKPLVYGAIFKFEGQVSVFNYNKTQESPSYRCLFPEPPKPEDAPNCSEIGVLGVLPGLVGTMQANEVLKIILEYGEVLTNKLLMVDARSMNNMVLEIKRNPETFELSKTNGRRIKEVDYATFCGVAEQSDTVSWEQAIEQELFLIDVREFGETPSPSQQHIQIPLSLLPFRHIEVPKDIEVGLFCQAGGRSMQAFNLLRNKFGFTNIKNIEGGMSEFPF